MFIDCRERKRGVEREGDIDVREKHRSVASPPETEPTAFRCTR